MEITPDQLYAKVAKELRTWDDEKFDALLMEVMSGRSGDVERSTFCAIMDEAKRRQEAL